MARKPMRNKPRDNGRRTKKKVSVLNTEKIEYVDYKDINLLRRFMSDRAKIRARRVTGNNSQQQREIARAIKNAREMALVPYTNRVTTQRGNPRGRGEGRGGDNERAGGPAPRPNTPPPPPGGVGSGPVDEEAVGEQVEQAAQAAEATAAAAAAPAEGATGDQA